MEDLDLEKKVRITDTMELELELDNNNNEKQKKIIVLLRSFLDIQQRRAHAYADLKRHGRGFDEYMVSGAEFPYQQLCATITSEFNDCSKQVLEMESQFQNPDFNRLDLAQLLMAVQTQKKQKLHLVRGSGTRAQ